MEFFFYVTATDDYTFDLTQLGYAANEAVPVYDIWAKQNEGTATGTLSVKVPSHGVKLYRLGEKVADLDGDGTVGSVDVNTIIRHILGDLPESFMKETADVNGDGYVNIVDLVIIIDIIQKHRYENTEDLIRHLSGIDNGNSRNGQGAN